MSEMDENFIHTKYGYCYYEIEEGKNPIIFNLYVHPEYRRNGRAKELLAYVIEQIRSTGYSGKIDIEAAPREQSISRESLSVFYRNMGLNVLENNQPNEQLKYLIENIASIYVKYPTDDCPNGIEVERCIQQNGSSLWAIRRSGFCLNKEGEWEFEPIPSSRTDEFFDRCRFASMDEALVFAQHILLAIHHTKAEFEVVSHG